MHRLFYCAACAGLVLSAARAEQCVGKSTLTIAGTVHGIETMREEPQAELETFFLLRVDKPICGKSEITANTIGSIACSEGEFLEATGQFSPPSHLTDTARLQLRGPVICRKAR